MSASDPDGRSRCVSLNLRPSGWGVSYPSAGGTRPGVLARKLKSARLLLPPPPVASEVKRKRLCARLLHINQISERAELYPTALCSRRRHGNTLPARFRELPDRVNPVSQRMGVKMLASAFRTSAATSSRFSDIWREVEPSLHGARLIAGIAGRIHAGTSGWTVTREHLVSRSNRGAADARRAGAAGSVLAGRRTHRSHGRGPQLRTSRPGRKGRFEGGHHLGGGAVAAAHGRIRVPDHDGVERTAGLGTDGVLHGLKSVQNHVGGLFNGVLPLQLTQLVKGRGHRLLYVLAEIRQNR